MKRYTLFIYAALLSIIGTLPMNAQQAQDALYIFRNDGGFMGFFFSDIDRIEYSKVDTLGVEQADYVTQEIHALDTIFRIPINAIDSVSFVTPETKYKADVAATTKSSLWDYVTGSDELTLYLASNTPSNVLPKSGDKIVTTKQTNKLPAGFVGKVSSVKTGGSEITIECEAVSLLDVFDQFVSKCSAQGSSAQTRSRGDSEISTHIDVPDISGSITLNNEYGFTEEVSVGATGSLGYNIKNAFDVRAFLQVSLWTGLQFGAIIRGEHDISVNYNVGGTLSYSKDINLARNITPTPLGPLLYFDNTAGLVFGGSGSIALSGDAGIGLRSYSLIQFNSQRDGQQQAVFDLSSTGFHKNLAKLSGNISLNAGAFIEFDITSICKDLDKAGARAEGGLRFELGADFKWRDVGDQKFITSTTMYEELNRDGSVAWKGYINGQLKAEVLKWKTSVIAEKTVGTPWEGGLVPNFSKIDTKQNGTTLEATVNLKGRDVLFENPVGAVIHNAKGTKIMEGLNDKDYYKKNFNSYTLSFPDMKFGNKLRLYPMTKLFGYELLATPYKEFSVDPWMEVTPSSISFSAAGGSQRFQITDNFEYSNDDDFLWEAIVNYGSDGKWLDPKWDGDDYVVTAGKNDSNKEKSATITFKISSESQGVNISKDVKVTQSAKSSEGGGGDDENDLKKQVDSAILGTWTRATVVGLELVIFDGGDGSGSYSRGTLGSDSTSGSYKITKYGKTTDGYLAGEMDVTTDKTRTRTFVIMGNELSYAGLTWKKSGN